MGDHSPYYFQRWYMLSGDERIDEINEYLRLIQKKDGLTFTTDAYLLAAFVSGRHERCADLGAGTGVVSLLCVQKDKAQTVYAIERQPEFAELVGRNAELNSLSERITAICGDVREIGRENVGGALDAVFANPPYFRAGAGIASKSPIMREARYEEHGTFADFAECAARLLRGGGSFYVVHRADRVTDVLAGMRGAGIEPKRMIFVYPDEKSAPNLLLVEGKKGAGAELKIAPPLVMYDAPPSGVNGERANESRPLASRKYTPELDLVYERCSLDHMFERSAK